MRCLDAIAAERTELGRPTEVLVLDNASDDGSADAVRARGDADLELVALAERVGKAWADSELMRRARGRFCLLLNEDSELLPGAAGALLEALEADPRAACAVAALRRPDGAPQPSAWRFPGVRVALLGALVVGRRYAVQSRGTAVRRVDWGQSAALLVRREAAAQVDWMDPAYFVYSDEVDFQKRLAGAGWHTLYVPAARAIHHEQLSTGALAARRIVELSRGRDRYMRTHEGRLAAAIVRLLTAWTYALRAVAATLLPGHDAARYRAHAAAALRPDRGGGLAEAAAEYNARAGRPLPLRPPGGPPAGRPVPPRRPGGPPAGAPPESPDG